MAKIAGAAFKNETLQKISSSLSYEFPATKAAAARTITPGHKMLYPSDSRYYEGMVGGKTGYTSLAGNTLVTCTEKDGVRLIAVVLKARSTHYGDTKAMLDYGYKKLQAFGSGPYHQWVQNGDGWYFRTADGQLLKGCRRSSTERNMALTMLEKCRRAGRSTERTGTISVQTALW